MILYTNVSYACLNKFITFYDELDNWLLFELNYYFQKLFSTDQTSQLHNYVITLTFQGEISIVSIKPLIEIFTQLNEVRMVNERRQSTDFNNSSTRIISRAIFFINHNENRNVSDNSYSIFLLRLTVATCGASLYSTHSGRKR